MAKRGSGAACGCYVGLVVVLYMFVLYLRGTAHCNTNIGISEPFEPKGVDDNRTTDPSANSSTALQTVRGIVQVLGRCCCCSGASKTQQPTFTIISHPVAADRLFSSTMGVLPINPSYPPMSRKGWHVTEPRPLLMLLHNFSSQPEHEYCAPPASLGSRRLRATCA